jgi:DNA polymerase IV
MIPSRSVIHLNVADFAVAVERAVDERLRGRPVIIVPPGATRAHVLDMSDEAYRAGVRKGMSLRQARAACRDAQLIPPHPDRYERAMREFLARALPFSPLIEVVDENGHLFLDVTGTGRLFGPPMDIAWRIRKETRAGLGFDPIWAVASNKLVAKVATRLVKPTGEYIVEPGAEEEFLRPLPLSLLPGLEREELLRLREFHLRRVADVARLTLPQLEVALSQPAAARGLYQAAHGVDDSPVQPVGLRRPVVAMDHDFGLNGGAMLFYAGFQRAAVSVQSFELRQQCRMNVQHAAAPARDEPRRQEPHEAGEADKIDAVRMQGVVESTLERLTVFAERPVIDDRGGDARKLCPAEPRGIGLIGQDHRDLRRIVRRCGRLDQCRHIRAAAGDQYGNALPGHAPGHARSRCPRKPTRAPSFAATISPS